MFANQGDGDVCVYNGADPALAGVGARRPRAASSTSATRACGELRALRCPAPTTPRTPRPRRSPPRRWGSAREAIASALRELRRRPAPARAGGRDRRRALRQRLEGDQRRRRGRRAALVRRRRARDPRRLAQGRRLRRARARGRRALRRRVPDRRGGRAARARPRARPGRPGSSTAAATGSPRRCGAAAADASAGEVVLLAPACASFDTYRDYEERGEHFRALVEELDR